MILIIASPRAVPPWDSASASLARSRLMVLTHHRLRKLFEEVWLLTLFRDYSRVKHVHENSFGNEVYHDYLLWLKSIGIKTLFTLGVDADLNPYKAKLLLDFILRSHLSKIDNEALVWYIGFTLINMRTKVKVIYEHFTLDEKLGYIMGSLTKSYIHIATSTSIALRIARHGIFTEYIPPAIDKSVFSPGFRLRLNWLIPYVERADIRLLYMGPLIPSRFPVKLILPAIMKIKQLGYNVVFIAIATARSRHSLAYYRLINELIQRYGLKQNLIVKLRIIVNEYEKAMLYRSFDSLVYTPLDSTEMADPPLTALEAMSCSVPAIVAPVGDLKYIIGKSNAGVVLSRFDVNELVKAILKVAENKQNFGKNARKVIDKFYSVNAVATRMYNLLIRLLS